ncbi:MAG: PKD domain-containing protein [Flavobacteriales bacterium]|nr:PKD domain-containing protein [Flavobacteriales bacterium]
MRKLGIILLLSIFQFSLKATHIVGGSLTYDRINDSTYAIVLKLYRDCGAGNAQFPNNVIIQVRNAKGNSFNPDRDISIPKPPTDTLDPIIDTCVIDPGICVEEAIYRDTVYNLHGDQGYHLFYSICCRNASVQNIINPLGTGESFYTYIPPNQPNSCPAPEDRAIWHEDFALNNGAFIDFGATQWSRAIAPLTDYAEVRNQAFEAVDTDGEVTWNSQNVNISAYPTGVQLYASLFNSCNLETGQDTIEVLYNLDGTGWVQFQNNGFFTGNFANGIVASTQVLTGTTVQIRVRMWNSANNEYYRIDDVIIAEPPTSTVNLANSSASFVNFPPIFVCANEVLNFDHSAIDPDGDSLVYSLYTPYDDNGPLFYYDSASFTPVSWQTGYDQNNPLGPGATTIDPITGMLTINPPQQGQFVVGVQVEEWRGCKLVNTTIRDFQFNVVNCPPIAQAGIILKTDSFSCNDSIVFFDSDITASSYYWDFGVTTSLADTSRDQQTSFSYPDTGTYIVTLIANYQTPCADTTFDTLTIDWLNVDFLSDAPKCEGQTINFTDQTTFSNNVSLLGWDWDFGNTGTSTNQNPSSQYNTSGNYSVKLKVSTTGCTDSIIRNVTINPAPQATVFNDTSVCGNSPTFDLSGAVNIATGGTWSTTASGFFDNPNALSTTYNLGVGDTSGAHYIVLETTGNGICPADRDSFLLTFIPGPILIPPADQTVCFGDTAKNITVTVYGGTPPYTFQWNSGETTQSINATPGTYIVTISDGNACSPIIDTVVIDQISVPIEALAGPDQNVCIYDLPVNLSGAVTGASGGLWLGSGSFSPSDDSLVTTYSPTNGEITAGVFDLILTTTGNGTCLADTDTTQIRIIDMTITNIDSIIPGCNQSNGSIMVSHTGGDSPFSYNWSGLASGQNNDTVSGLPVGFYQVTISDNNGCIVDTIIDLNNNQPTLTITDTTHVRCYGGNTGSATALGLGGVPAYTYVWDSNAGGQTNATATGLTAGTYSVTVTDNINCSAVESVVIDEPDDSIWIATVINDDLLCNGDSNGVISVSGEGGNGGFTYQWSTIPVQTDSFATGLSAGTYSVTLTDDSLCSDSFDLSISEPLPLTINALPISNYNGFNISCNGLSDGSAIANGAGGVGDYSYLWSDNNNQVTAQANTLSAGSYTVTVSDSNNCSIDTTIILNEPSNLLVQTSIDSNYNGQNVSCHGDSNAYVSALASGSVPGYTYLWNDSTTNLQNGPIPAGTYLVTVTDTNGCTNSASVVISQPTPLTTASILGIDATCFDSTDAQSTVSVSGGTPGYTYLWDSLANFQTTSTATGLGAGTYSVTVTDSNGCTIDTSYVINEPPALSVQAFFSDTICPLDSHDISANALGGNGNFTYIWNMNLDSGQTHFVSPVSTTTYTVTAYDITGCASPPDSVTVFVRVFDPDSVDLFSTGNVCQGLSTEISTNYNGAFPPYTYVWSSGHGGPGPHVVTPLVDTYYILTITDECNNQLIDSILIEVYDYPDSTLFPFNVSGCADLSVLFTDSSSNSGAQYVWGYNGETIEGDFFEETFTLAGNYIVSVTITSADSCTVEVDTAAIIDVFAKPEITCVASTNQTSIVEAEVDFNSAPSDLVSYTWNFGDGGTDSIQAPTHTFEDTGTYVISVIGATNLGCTDTCYQIVIVDPSFLIDVPNAFIPNQGGPTGGKYNINSLDNTIFFPVVEFVDDFKMMIFNRWGEMVFITEDITIGWDGYYKGELLQQDVYAYKIEVRFINGNNRTLTGDVTLIR